MQDSTCLPSAPSKLAGRAVAMQKDRRLARLRAGYSCALPAAEASVLGALLVDAAACASLTSRGFTAPATGIFAAKPAVGGKRLAWSVVGLLGSSCITAGGSSACAAATREVSWAQKTWMSLCHHGSMAMQMHRELQPCRMTEPPGISQQQVQS